MVASAGGGTQAARSQARTACRAGSGLHQEVEQAHRRRESRREEGKFEARERSSSAVVARREVRAALPVARAPRAP